jgi:hypothetical protein
MSLFVLCSFFFFFYFHIIVFLWDLIPNSVSIVEANTMTESILLNSPSKILHQYTFGDFEKHTRGIRSKIMRKMGYYGLGKEGKWIMIPIVPQQRPKHEGLGFNGK